MIDGNVILHCGHDICRHRKVCDKPERSSKITSFACTFDRDPDTAKYKFEVQIPSAILCCHKVKTGLLFYDQPTQPLGKVSCKWLQK